MLRKITLFVVLSIFQNLSFGQCGVDFSTQSSTIGSYGVDIDVAGVSTSVVYSVAVEWGDMSTPSLGFGSQYSHTYATPGTYDICIDYISVDGCYQQVCKSFTITSIPNLCPLTVNPTLSGNTLTLDATGSDAFAPYLVFFFDIWAYVNDPSNFSLFEHYVGHSNTFSHTYPTTTGQSYTYCVEYGDANEPESCEANSYCATISFGEGLGLNQIDAMTEVQIFPVPATNFLNVSIDEEIVNDIEYLVYDLLGNEIFSGKIDSEVTTILFPNSMSEGKYFIKISGSNSSQTLSFNKI